MDKRPRRRDGSIYFMCSRCGIEPEQCKGYCVVNILEKEAEQRTKRRKADGSRIQRQGRTE